MSYQILVPLIFLCALSTGCERGEAPVPAYLHLEAGGLTTVYATQGSASNEIQDIWLFADQQLIGVNEMPATFPVLEEGPKEVVLRPGVLLNGQFDRHIVYPFYSEVRTTHNFVPGQVDTLRPVFAYNANARFAFIEGFDGVGTILSDELDTNPATNVAISNDSPLEGPLGKITVTTANQLCRVGTSQRFALPTDNRPVFLEMDYRCDIPFTVGITAHAGALFESQSKITLVVREDWNKIYLEFTPEVSLYNAPEYSIYLQAQLPFGQTEGHVWLDNLKLVYFE
jgi:hypothetical protein